MSMSVETAELILRRCIRFSRLTEEQNVETIWLTEAGEETGIGYFGYDQHNVLIKLFGRDEEFIGTEALRLRECGRTE